MSFLTGGSHQSSTSGNQAYNYLSGALAPSVSTGTAANDQIADALGVGTDPAAAAQGVQNYFNSAGGQFTMQQGTQAINNDAAAKGLLNSGATLKALQSFGQNTGQQYYQNYLSNLNSLAANGNTAAGIIGGAGQTSTSTGSSTPGLLGALGNAGKGIASLATLSDPRVKRDVVRLETLPDGLGIYEYRYAGQSRREVGVMADEVAVLRPWALGPKIQGYRTVRYDLLGEAA